MNKIILLFIIYFIFLTQLLAQSEKQIVIKGNEFIDDDVIYSIIGKNVDESSADYINKIIKLLYDTGNFKEIEVEEKNNEIIIKITENSRINKVNLNGNKRFKTDIIFEQFDQEEYFQYVNEIKINQFIEELKKLYLSYGYNQIDIQYKIIESIENNNTVDLDFHFSEGSISKINKIYFIGNIYFDKRNLLAEIQSNENNILILFRNENYKEYQIKNDVIALKDFYKNNGFRDIKINYKSEYFNLKNKFNVYFYIDEGKQYYFDKFNLNVDTINISKSKIDELESIITNYYSSKIENDNMYNRFQLEELKRLITDFLFVNGTIFFNIKVLEKIKDSKVDILYKIENSKPKYVNQINIFGNSRTLDKVVRREVTFSEGDAINSDLIQSTQRNLNSLRIFRTVNIEEVIISDDFVDVNIYVEEQSTGEFQVGLSFGTLEGTTFVSGLKEKNISGLGREIDLTINTSPTNTKYNFGIVEPYFFNNPINFIYGISFEEKDYSSASSYNLNSFTTNTGFNYILSTDLLHEVTIEYRLKEYKITNSETVSSDIQNLAGNNADILLNNDFIFNQLNSFIRPTKGIYLNYENIISPITNSNNGYIKNILTYKKYHKYKRNVLSISSKIGNIYSLQNSEIATDDKFALGGRWLRGFDAFGVGPRKSRTSYIGGKNLIVAKFDLNRSLNKNLNNPIDLNLFVDIGTVFENKNTPTNAKESIRSSYGAGIKFYSPIGPIGLSWAFPITSESYDIKRMFLFSIGNLN